MDKLARLEAEADRRGTALATAASRFARRFSPLKLADEALGRLGPASDIVERAVRVTNGNPLVVAVLALSAAFLTWQYLSTTAHPVSAHLRRLPARRRRPARTSGRRLPAPVTATEGVET